MIISGKIRNLIPYQPYHQPSYLTEISQQIERIQSDQKTKNSSGDLCNRCKSKVGFPTSLGNPDFSKLMIYLYREATA